MKLYTSLTSPYGRKCRMAAQVAGTLDRVEVVAIDYKSDAYAKINPLKKVPALEREDGSVLVDSPVICAYLASLGDTPKVMPADENARWLSLSQEAMADAITDAGVAIFMENKREGALHSSDVVAFQTAKINAGLDAIESQAANFGERTDIGVLAAAACVAWLEFRTIVPAIREGRPNMAAWLDSLNGRDFMDVSAPPAGA